ncbi:2-hydroxycarboxylate transporter family protein [Bosea sp. BH3]|nr:2-hydroxycarboxylate transporter family protein [Bosea sp. BH3]
MPLWGSLALAASFAVVLLLPAATPHAGLVLPLLGGFALAALARRVRLLQGIGAAPLLALLLPSWLVSIDVIPEASLSSLRTILRETDALGLFVTMLVMGSVLALPKEMLSKAAWRVFSISVVASAAALAAGALAAGLLGLPVREVAFLVLAPASAGGISAGAMPLASGYAQLSAAPLGELLARMLPSIFAANLFAMLLAGIIRSDRGREEITLVDVASPVAAISTRPVFSRAAWLFVAALALWLVDEAVSALALASGWPASLLMLVVAATWCLLGWGRRLRDGIVDLYRLCLRFLIYPIIFIVGLLLVPWSQLVEGFTSPGLVLPVAAAVAGMATGGAAVSRRLGLTRAEGAILALTRAAMGGTGAVAILGAAGRLDLMSHAQMITRFGGALTLAVALTAAGIVGI